MILIHSFAWSLLGGRCEPCRRGGTVSVPVSHGFGDRLARGPHGDDHGLAPGGVTKVEYSEAPRHRKDVHNYNNILNKPLYNISLLKSEMTFIRCRISASSSEVKMRNLDDGENWWFPTAMNNHAMQLHTLVRIWQ